MLFQQGLICRFPIKKNVYVRLSLEVVVILGHISTSKLKISAIKKVVFALS
jgi:hypothetical protein